MKVLIPSQTVIFTLVMLLLMPCNYVRVEKVDDAPEKVEGTLNDQDIAEMDRQSKKLNDMLSELDGLSDVLRGPLQDIQDAKMKYANFVQAEGSSDKLTDEQIKELDDFNGFAKHTSESRENDHAHQKRKNEDSSATKESTDSSAKSKNEGGGSFEKGESDDDASVNRQGGSGKKSDGHTPPHYMSDAMMKELDALGDAFGEAANGVGDTSGDSREDIPRAKIDAMNFFQARGSPDLNFFQAGGSPDMNFFQAGGSPDRLTDEQVKELENLDFSDLDDDASVESENEDSSEKSENEDSSEKSENGDPSGKGENEDSPEKSENEDSSAKGESDDASVNRGSGESNSPYYMPDDMLKQLDALAANGGSLQDIPQASMRGMNFFQVGEGLDRLSERQVEQLRKLPEILATQMEEFDEADFTEKQFAGSDNSGANEDSDRNEKVAGTVSGVENEDSSRNERVAQTESKKGRPTETCSALSDGVCLDDSRLQNPIPNILRKEGESDPVPNILRKEGESDPIPNILNQQGDSDPISNKLSKEGESDPVPNIFRKAEEKDSIPMHGAEDDAEMEADVEIITEQPTKYAETKPNKYTKENNNGKETKKRKKNAFADLGMSMEEAEEFEAFVNTYHPGKEEENIVSEEEIEKMNIALKDFL